MVSINVCLDCTVYIFIICTLNLRHACLLILTSCILTYFSLLTTLLLVGTLQKHTLLPATMALFYLDFLSSTPRCGVILNTWINALQLLSFFHPDFCLSYQISFPKHSSMSVFLGSTICSSLCQFLCLMKHYDKGWFSSILQE